jgi:hypothetical protein
MQERLEEVEQREVAVEREATHVRALQQQLLGQHPDLHRLSEMMSERQREEREARDAKVLRVLRTKDQSIATLNGQVQGLERSLDETRAKLGAADRALEDKHKEMERAFRDHQASLASAQVSLVFPCLLALPPPARWASHAALRVRWRACSLSAVACSASGGRLWCAALTTRLWCPPFSPFLSHPPPNHTRCAAQVEGGAGRGAGAARQAQRHAGCCRAE